MGSPFPPLPPPPPLTGKASRKQACHQATWKQTTSRQSPVLRGKHVPIPATERSQPLLHLLATLAGTEGQPGVVPQPHSRCPESRREGPGLSRHSVISSYTIKDEPWLMPIQSRGQKVLQDGRRPGWPVSLRETTPLPPVRPSPATQRMQAQGTVVWALLNWYERQWWVVDLLGGGDTRTWADRLPPAHPLQPSLAQSPTLVSAPVYR